MSRDSPKSQFIQHSLAVINSKQSKQFSEHETKDSLPSDHPFYSQYNQLKLKNLLHCEDKVAMLSKSSQKQLDGDCQREFERFVRYWIGYKNKLYKISKTS